MRKMPLCVLLFVIFFLFVNIGFSDALLAADKKEPPKFAGAFFNTPVSLENYYFIKGVFAVFGNKFGPQPNTPQEAEDAIWEQLILSYEAFRRGVTVTEEEVGQEVAKILAAEKVSFNWKTDKDSYEKWVKEKTNLPSAAIFEGQLKHLIQIQKLRTQVMQSIDPPVSGQEAYQEFLNEYNNLSVELVQFDDLKDAKAFYRKAKRDPGFWDTEKEKMPKDFKRPGAVSLEFLMDLWGFDKKASYEMMRLKPGQLHPPAPIYKGYGVFKVLNRTPADTKRYNKVKAGYYDQIRDRKRLQAINQWIKDLKKEADIKIYTQEGQG